MSPVRWIDRQFQQRFNPHTALFEKDLRTTVVSVYYVREATLMHLH